MFIFTSRRLLFLQHIFLMLIITSTNILPNPTRLHGLSQPAKPATSIKPDILAYVSEDNQLILYDLNSRTEKIVMDNVENFSISPTGRIAYTRLDEHDTGFYIFDPVNPEAKLVTIDQPMAYPLSWSPDGHYLTYTVFNSEIEGRDLYVWDGETVVNITPEDTLASPSQYQLLWSQDGRLAFDITYGWSGRYPPSELYIWDGHSTHNLSQNPHYADGLLEWSDDGQLMFVSWTEDKFDIYIWDGISFDGTSPDKNTFTRILSEFEVQDITWLDTHRIVFISLNTSASSTTKEVMVWDMENDVIIDRFPVKSELARSRLSHDAQFIFSTHLSSGLPSMYLEIEDTKGNILLSTEVSELSWSRNGYLAYCGIDGVKIELLNVWDGKETWLVKRLSNRPIQWQTTGHTFSCNNG